MKRWTLKVEGKFFVVNQIVVIIGVILIGGVIVVSLFSLGKGINSNIKKEQISYIKEKERWINTKIKTFKKKIEKLEEVFNAVVKLDEKERMLWNLLSIDEDIRSVGIGGKVEMEYNHPIDEIIFQLDELDRKIKFEVSSFTEIYTHAKKRMKKFSYTPSIWPTGGYVSSPFGWRRVNGRKEFHEGIDISNSMGTIVRATAEGVVSYIGYKKGFGLVVEIIHNNHIKTRYAHLMNAVVKEGDKVKRGSIIGKTGLSGRTTGPHLHYEVIVKGRKENPLKYILPGKVTY